MECLEVLVNGERHCVAARSRAHRVSADITRFADDRGRDRATGLLSVSGLSPILGTHLAWGGGDRSLAIGDAVTIRVLKANTADRPAPSRSQFVVDDDIAEPVSSFGDRLANDPLNFFANDNLRPLLFWVAVTILALVAWLIR